LSVNSVSPVLAIDPGMMVDFGGVDVEQTTAKTLTITLRNTGDGVMDLNSGNALAGVFTSAAVSAQKVAVGGQTTINVSYLPAVEKSAGAPDSATITLSTSGLIDKGT